MNKTNQQSKYSNYQSDKSKIYQSFYQSEYPAMEDVCDIVLEELNNLKRDQRITAEKSYEDLFVSPTGDVYVADTYPVWVEYIDTHGVTQVPSYEPDLENALIVVTKRELDILV